MSVAKPRTISEYIKDQKRANCPVCRLPKAVRMEMVQARRGQVNVAVILEWLAKEYGVKITREEYRRHAGAMHDGKDGLIS